MQAMDDMALLREYATRHSEAAFEALVTRRIGFVYSGALRQVRKPHLAEEITQAVFVILAQKAGRIPEKTVLIGWLFRTTRYAALAQIRAAIARQRREQEAQMQTELQAATADPQWEQMFPLLDEALAALGEKDRQAILLRFCENKSLAEVGNSLGLGEDTARKRVSRALEKLRKFFAKRGVNSTTAFLAGTISANAVQATPGALAKSVAGVALTKGAVASISTVTVIKGTLKLMAWTKLKTTVAAGGMLLLAAGVGLIVIEDVQAWRVANYPNIQGAWEGVMLLDYDGVGPGEAARTHVVLKFVRTNDGYTATTDWIEMGRKNVPMGDVVYHYPALQIKRNPRDTWKLRVNANATQMILDHAIHIIQPDPVLFLRTSTPDPVPGRLTEAEFSPRAVSDLQGYWKGEFNTGSKAVPVNLKIAELADGTFRAEGDSPMEGVIGRPGTVSYNRPLVKFADAGGGGLFQGTLNADHTELIGSWTQGGKSVPAILKRADYRAEHAQDAEKDYSFRSRNDLQGHWKGSWKIWKVKIRLALDIARLPDGSYSATLSSIDQFGNDAPIPASAFHYSSPKVLLDWKWVGGAYQGRLENGKLAGVWLQGGGSFPLTFERTGSK
jgi:RNA polymerase sigma factor (sigma-70 family)